MVNECYVFYKGEKGLMTFDNKKVVFQHNGGDGSDAKVGLGVFVEGSLVDKETYSFAEFVNIETVIPENYNEIIFFNNKGVPKKVEKGTYGDNVFLKELYKNNEVIRAYNKRGRIVFYENKLKKSKSFVGSNMYYDRINELIGDWDDITLDLRSSLEENLRSKDTEVPLDNEKVQSALKGLSKDKLFIMPNGVIIADGNFESLAIWKEDDEICMAWLGYIVDKESLSCKELEV